MPNTGIIMIRLAHRKARGFHRSIWKILRLQNTKSILLCFNLHDITWGEKIWANSAEKNEEHTKNVHLSVTFKWRWKLDLSGRSVLSLIKWVNCLGTSQLSFSFLLLRVWCAGFNLRMPQGDAIMLSDWAEKNLHLALTLNNPPCSVDTPDMCHHPTSCPAVAKIGFFLFVCSFFFNFIFMSLPGSPSDCQEAAMRVRWCDNCCARLLLHLFASPGLSASIFSYVNVTMLPHGPHNIHLLVEMPQHQSHCALIHCWCCRKKGGMGGGANILSLFWER